jgi:hypothetical protein
MENKILYWTLIALAALLSLCTSFMGLVIWGFFSDPNNPYFLAKLFYIAPMTAMPLFLLIFISRRSVASAAWGVAAATCLGAYLQMHFYFSNRSLERPIGVRSVLLQLIGPWLVPIFTSIILEYVCFMERRRRTG